MKSTLDEARTPLDCRLEAVLPAVHQRFDASHKATVDVRNEVSALRDEFRNYRESRYSENDEMMNTMMNTIFQRLQDGLNGFLSGLSGGSTSSTSNRMVAEAGGSISTVPTAAVVAQERQRMQVGRNNKRHHDAYPVIKLLSKYKDLHTFHQHWYG